MSIPISKPFFTGGEGAAVAAAVESGWVSQGPRVREFEEVFARRVGAADAVAVTSCTTALQLALYVTGVRPGDEVIVPSLSFIATANAVWQCGATPVFADIDPRTYNLDPAATERAITPRTRAILPVHLYGQPADMDPILATARRNALTVIEDACQAHGARYKGRPVGTLGDLACFSFYPGKNLGACGEGGIVVTGNDTAARVIRMLRDWGGERKYEHVLKGFNYRMEALQGAILRVKLRHLESWTEARRAHAAAYDRLLQGGPVATPLARADVRHVYHIYAVRTAERALLQQHLQEQGIQTGIHYPVPVHLQPAFADLGHQRGDFPQSERAADEVLSLPMYAELPLADQERVANAVCECAYAG
jgi:dTDP-4-amino-4,6-dideoxygalactose transaminase